MKEIVCSWIVLLWGKYQKRQSQQAKIQKLARNGQISQYWSFSSPTCAANDVFSKHKLVINEVSPDAAFIADLMYAGIIQ